MSLLPFVLREFINASSRPLRIIEPQIFQPVEYLYPSVFRSPWFDSVYNQGSSEIKENKDNFEISVDVKQFSPQEITVKTVEDHAIVIEGKHEEHKDQHNYIARHFVKKYDVPQGMDLQKIVSSLSLDGLLTIKAPKLAVENKTERIIPITHEKSNHNNK